MYIVKGNFFFVIHDVNIIIKILFIVIGILYNIILNFLFYRRKKDVLTKEHS